MRQITVVVMYFVIHKMNPESQPYIVYNSLTTSSSDLTNSIKTSMSLAHDLDYTFFIFFSVSILCNFS